MKPYRLQTDGTTKSPAGIQPVSVGTTTAGARWTGEGPPLPYLCVSRGPVHFPVGERHDLLPGLEKPLWKVPAPIGLRARGWP